MRRMPKKKSILRLFNLSFTHLSLSLPFLFNDILYPKNRAFSSPLPPPPPRLHHRRPSRRRRRRRWLPPPPSLRWLSSPPSRRSSSTRPVSHPLPPSFSLRAAESAVAGRFSSSGAAASARARAEESSTAVFFRAQFDWGGLVSDAAAAHRFAWRSYYRVVS